MSSTNKITDASRIAPMVQQYRLCKQNPIFVGTGVTGSSISQKKTDLPKKCPRASNETRGQYF